MRDMQGQDTKVDELIKYLFRVFNGVELTQESMAEKKKFGEYINDDEIVRSQDFFIMPKELDLIIEEWFIGFTNKDQLNKTLKFKLEELKKMKKAGALKKTEPKPDMDLPKIKADSLPPVMMGRKGQFEMIPDFLQKKAVQKDLTSLGEMDMMQAALKK